MESKRNKGGDLVVTMSEKERFHACKALETVCDILFSLEKSPLTDEQRGALAELAEIIDVDTQKDNENEDFTKMFFRVIDLFDYPGTRIIKMKMLINKRYPESLKKRCEKKSEHYCISVHDALFSILEHGEITKVYNRYLNTNKL